LTLKAAWGSYGSCGQVEKSSFCENEERGFESRQLPLLEDVMKDVMKKVSIQVAEGIRLQI